MDDNHIEYNTSTICLLNTMFTMLLLRVCNQLIKQAIYVLPKKFDKYDHFYFLLFLLNVLSQTKVSKHKVHIVWWFSIFRVCLDKWNILYCCVGVGCTSSDSLYMPTVFKRQTWGKSCSVTSSTDIFGNSDNFNKI